MRSQDVIRRKRDGGELSRDEIAFFVRGVSRGEVADYQASALLMAIFLNGMTEAEQHALTEEMLGSGERSGFLRHRATQGRQAFDGRRRR